MSHKFLKSRGYKTTGCGSTIPKELEACLLVYNFSILSVVIHTFHIDVHCIKLTSDLPLLTFIKKNHLARFWIFMGDPSVKQKGSYYDIMMINNVILAQNIIKCYEMSFKLTW